MRFILLGLSSRTDSGPSEDLLVPSFPCRCVRRIHRAQWSSSCFPLPVPPHHSFAVCCLQVCAWPLLCGGGPGCGGSSAGCVADEGESPLRMEVLMAEAAAVPAVWDLGGAVLPDDPRPSFFRCSKIFVLLLEQFPLLIITSASPPLLSHRFYLLSSRIMSESFFSSFCTSSSSCAASRLLLSPDRFFKLLLVRLPTSVCSACLLFQMRRLPGDLLESHLRDILRVWVGVHELLSELTLVAHPPWLSVSSRISHAGSKSAPLVSQSLFTHNREVVSAAVLRRLSSSLSAPSLASHSRLCQSCS